MSNYHLDVEAIAAEQQSFLVRVFTWLGIGLVLSSVTAYYAGTTETTVDFLTNGGFAVLAVLLMPIAILVFLNYRMDKISGRAAQGIYCLFCTVQGFALGSIFIAYTTASIVQAFAVASGMFLAAAAYGYITKKDLSSLGSILFMALIGLLIAMVVNMFWANSTLYWITTFAGILIFLGLTVYDMQKIKKRNVIGNAGTDEDTKEAIWGAIDLYLDLVNLFLFILRIMGSRR